MTDICPRMQTVTVKPKSDYEIIFHPPKTFNGCFSFVRVPEIDYDAFRVRHVRLGSAGCFPTNAMYPTLPLFQERMFYNAEDCMWMPIYLGVVNVSEKDQLFSITIEESI